MNGWRFAGREDCHGRLRRCGVASLACCLAWPLLVHAHETSRPAAQRDMSYGELVARAEVVSVTTDGQAYAHRLYEEQTHVGEPAGQACSDGVAVRSPHTFTLAAFVRPDGTLENVRVAPDDALARCFAGRLQSVKWPAPPGKAGAIVALRFDAPTGVLVDVVGVAAPSTSPPPPPGPPTAPFAVYDPPPLRPPGMPDHCRSIAELTAGPDGAVRRAIIVASCNQPAADAAVLDAVNQWVIAMPQGFNTRSVRVPFEF